MYRFAVGLIGYSKLSTKFRHLKAAPPSTGCSAEHIRSIQSSTVVFGSRSVTVADTGTVVADTAAAGTDGGPY